MEQNYRGNTVSEWLPLSLDEGKTIDFEVDGTDGAPPRIVEGKIIRSGYSPDSQNSYSYNNYGRNQSDNTPLIEVDGKLQLGLSGKPLFPALAADSISTPTLNWSISTSSEKCVKLDAHSIEFDVIVPPNGKETVTRFAYCTR